MTIALTEKYAKVLTDALINNATSFTIETIEAENFIYKQVTFTDAEEVIKNLITELFILQIKSNL